MKSFLRIIVFILAGLLLLITSSTPAQTNSSNKGIKAAKAYLITCKGLIDSGLHKSLQRRTKIAIDNNADYIIYQVETYGGLLISGDDIAKYLLQIGKKTHTIAYITTEALSAGAMISVSCRDIIMSDIATIGDCAPIRLQPGGKLEGTEREKAESPIRGMFDRASEANHYPQALLRAMVTQRIEVYQIKNNKTGDYEYFESDDIPQDANVYDLKNKKLIVSKDELLTVTASKAHEYGIARAVVNDLQGLLSFIEERDGVKFAQMPVTLETNWSEQMVRWLNHPAVLSVLVLLALLGLYTELSTPGLGLPGLLAVISFAIIVGSKYLTGLANWVEVVFFILGILLLFIEFFVLPGFGIAGVLGILFTLAGIFGMLVRNPPDKLPWPQTTFDWEILIYNSLAIFVGFVASAVLASLLARYLPKFRFLSGLMLAPAVAKKGTEFEASFTTEPESETEKLTIGDIGQTITKLRPAGRARFAGAVVDCVAGGEFLEKGTKVKIIEIHGNRVVVQKTEEQKEG